MPKKAQKETRVELTDDQVLDLFKSRWLTSTEAARLLGVTWPDSIRKILRDYPEMRREHIGRDLYISRSVLEEYRRTKAPTGRKPKGLTR